MLPKLEGYDVFDVSRRSPPATRCGVVLCSLFELSQSRELWRLSQGRSSDRGQLRGLPYAKTANGTHRVRFKRQEGEAPGSQSSNCDLRGEQAAVTLGAANGICESTMCGGRSDRNRARRW